MIAEVSNEVDDQRTCNTVIDVGLEQVELILVGYQLLKDYLVLRPLEEMDEKLYDQVT